MGVREMGIITHHRLDIARGTSFAGTHRGNYTKSNKYSSWRQLLKLPPTAQDLRIIQQVWIGALSIVNGAEGEITQALARDLVDPGLFGFKHIDAVLDNIHTQQNIVEYAQPFLLVISHPALLDCLSINTYVNDLYKFISGGSGDRAVRFFTQVCSALLEGVGTKAPSVQNCLAAVSVALCEAIRRDQSVIFNENVPSLLVLIDRIIRLAGIPESSSYHIVTNRVQRLQRMLCRLEGFESIHKTGPTCANAEFSRRPKFSGSSGQYDGLDITKVEILPTNADIRRAAMKTLPSTDFDRPYILEGVERLLDVHFHLLRHDTLGALEIRLNRLLKALENDPRLEFTSLDKLQNPEFFIYDNVHIRNLLFSQKLGLETELCFRQPRRKNKQPLYGREKQWKDTRRMQEGSLTCLITLHKKIKSILFFTISQGVTPIKTSHGLNSDDCHVVITAKLAQEENGDRVNQLLQVISQRKNVRSILVEFPGVLLPTFAPVLKNLQHMQFESWLPFQQWIMPQRQPKFQTLAIPPPLYARVPG